MSYKYSRYISTVIRHPWALLPEKLDDIRALMALRASGQKLSDEDIAERFRGGRNYAAFLANGIIAGDIRIDLGDDGVLRAAMGSSNVRSDGSVAVIPIHGCIAHRADSFEASSGGTSTELIGRILQRAVSDESVKAILLDFESPGGSVNGVPELASQIAKATAVKPVVAHLNSYAASAGYWLASQCSEIVCTPSGSAGSIGVYLLLLDESEALANEGYKINAISAGDNKLEGASWQALSDESRAFFQAQVDKVYMDFLSAVAKGRGVSVADVKKNFGQGRMFDAKTCLSLGMVDRIATFDDTLAKLVNGRASVGGARASMAPSDALIVAGSVDIKQVVRAAIDNPIACETCGGSGLKPEKFMGDPEGQEPCPDCGKAPASESEPDQALIDEHAILALMD